MSSFVNSTSLVSLSVYTEQVVECEGISLSILAICVAVVFCTTMTEMNCSAGKGDS